MIYQVFSSDIKISKISQCQKNAIDLQRLKCQNNKHLQQKQSKKIFFLSLYTAPLVNSIKLGFNFPCVEAFLFKKKNLFKKKLNFLHINLCIIFLIKSFVEKTCTSV